jgi:hypothetical protein
MRRIWITVLIAAAVTASSALAGRSGGATLFVSPNAAPAWAHTDVTGCGYTTASVVYLDVQKPAALAFYGVMPDSNGCIALTISTDEPGTYSLQTRQQLSNGKKWTVMATYQLPVV